MELDNPDRKVGSHRTSDNHELVWSDQFLRLAASVTSNGEGSPKSPTPALEPSVADPCTNMATDKKSSSSSKYTLEPHSPALFSDRRKHRNRSRTGGDCVEILPGLFESTCFDKYLALSLGDDLSFQDMDIFDMHRDSEKYWERAQNIVPVGWHLVD